MKKILTCLIAFFTVNSICALEINIVNNNELEPSYVGKSITEFEDYLANTNDYLCVDRNPFGAELYTMYRIVSFNTAEKVYTLERKIDNAATDSSSKIELNGSNFEDFCESFTPLSCLKFLESGFEVRFLKVQTLAMQGPINYFLTTENENEPKNNNSDIKTFLYCYKSKIVNGNHYVLVGNEPNLNSYSSETAEKELLGWVKIKTGDGDLENLILWNANIGITPNFSQTSNKNLPLVFGKSSSSELYLYKFMGTIPDSDKLLVDEKGLENLQKRMNDKNGQTYRWMPIYTDSTEYLSLGVGVLENSGILKSSVMNTIASDIHLHFLVDATRSMGPVWENMPDLLIETINSLYQKNLKDYTNNPVNYKIKIDYVNTDFGTLNKDHYIENVNDIEDYRFQMANIDLKYTESYYPDLSTSINDILNSEKNEPTIICIIGDSGAEGINGSFHSELNLYNTDEERYINIMGIRVNSRFDHHLFDAGYQRFANNLQPNLLYTVEDMSLLNQENSVIAENIANSIYNELSELILITQDYLIYSDNQDEDSVNNLSVFNKIWINKQKEKLSQLSDTGSSQLYSGFGTFFQEGLILGDRTPNLDEKSYIEEVFIKKDILIKLRGEIRELKTNMSKLEFTNAIRNIVAIFYQTNAGEIHDHMETISLHDLWNKIIGNTAISKTMLPDIFRYNVTIQEIIERWGDPEFTTQFINNTTDISNAIDMYDATEKNRIIIPKYDSDMKSGDIYYWIPVSKLNLFKDINFD